jgi:DegV family protein with EDD domain
VPELHGLLVTYQGDKGDLVGRICQSSGKITTSGEPAELWLDYGNILPSRKRPTMGQTQTAISYLDGPRLLRAISAGIHHVFRRRDYLNKINVFPVPDGDTGTNLAFTFKAILDATSAEDRQRIDELMQLIAETALDGARGNSGAIMAQYFHGFSEATAGSRILTAGDLASAARAGAEAAWKAMAKPVAGTLPTVLEDFSDELNQQISAGNHDIRLLVKHGLQRAHKSLANTPNQLAVLRQAGVVDAGGQGFVDLLEGIWSFIEKGSVDSLPDTMSELPAVSTDTLEVGEHRYCTECVIAGTGLDRDAVMRELNDLDCSSLVVAGGQERIRVHIHVNNPAEVFLSCERHGAIAQQKADDMHRQHSLMNQAGSVAIVTDSGADIPAAEIERLGIHVVPVRLSFGDREYLDGVSLTSKEFYRLLEQSAEAPLTSQPPIQDFSRIYTLLTSHDYEVVSLGLSSQMSGTTASAIAAADKQPSGKVHIIDTLNVTTGQGLLTVAAAEAAELGFSVNEIDALISELAPATRVFAIADDLNYAVKGGRVPAWVKKLTELLHINPVLTASPQGKITLAGFHLRRGANPQALARTATGKMQQNHMYRVMVAHANNPEGAAELRRQVLRKHGQIHSCHLTEAGPALGVHLGPGGLIVAFMPQSDLLS